MKHKCIVFVSTLTGSEVASNFSQTSIPKESLPANSKIVMILIDRKKSPLSQTYPNWTDLNPHKTVRTFSNKRKAIKHINRFIALDSKKNKKNNVMAVYSRAETSGFSL